MLCSYRYLVYILFVLPLVSTIFSPKIARADSNEADELEIQSEISPLLKREKFDFYSTSVGKNLPRRENYFSKSYNSIVKATPSDISIIFDTPDRKDAALSAGEFYTFLRIDNFFNDDALYRKSICGDGSDGSFFAMSLSIEYQPQGTQPITITPETVSLVSANNTTTAGVRIKGCTVNSPKPSQSSHYMIFSNYSRGEGEYILHFKVATGVTKSKKLLEQFAKLVTSVVAIFPGFTIPVGAAAATNTLGATLDAAFNNNSGWAVNSQWTGVVTAARSADLTNNEVAVYEKHAPWKRVTGHYLRIGFPYIDVQNELKKSKNWKFKPCFLLGNGKNPANCAGFWEVYQGRSASIVFDAGDPLSEVDAKNLLVTFFSLGIQHRCFVGTQSCAKDSPVAARFEDALGVGFSLERAADLTSAERKSGPAQPPSGAENWAGVFGACKKIRDKAYELGLSSIDALIVRWALLNKADLFDMVAQYQDHEGKFYKPEIRMQTEKTYGAAIAASAQYIGDRGIDRCWSPNDMARLVKLEQVMGRKLSPALPKL